MHATSASQLDGIVPGREGTGEVSSNGTRGSRVPRSRLLEWPRSGNPTQAETDSQELSRAILASLPGVVLLVDRAGTVLSTNASAHGGGDALTWLALAKPGDNYYDCWAGCETCHLACASRVLDAVRAVAKGHEIERSAECQYGTVDGEGWVEVRAHRLNLLEGGVVVHHLDVTARKRAEKVARQELEAAWHSDRLAAMGKLAASLAHEVSQPLAAILSNAEAAIRCLDRPAFMVEETLGALGDVAADARRAAAIIQNIRTLLKGREVQFSCVSVNSAVRDALRLIAHKAQLQKVRLDLDLAAHLPMVRANHVQLQQVVLNLAANGVDAMESSAENRRLLTIRTKMDDSGTGVLIEVSDLGEGIAEDDLMTVFEPFRSTKRDGLGMGLGISRSIVEAAGGRIWPKRRAGGGTSFFVLLPAVEASAQNQ